jgi:RNA polymerase sigma-70 factor (ECF subfamily)
MGTFLLLKHPANMTIRSGSSLPSRPTESESSALSDGALVTRVRSGDLAAFELIMRRHNQRLYRLARGILRNAAEAEDAVQEAYVRGFEKLGDFTGPEGFAAWLGRIVINEALGRIRRQSKVVSLDDYANVHDGRSEGRRLDAIKSPEPDPERLASNVELRGVLERAIDRLPEDFRVVFILRAVEGMSVADVAEYLSIREQTVKTRLHRARKQIQESLGEQFDALLPGTFSFAGDRCDRIVAGALARATTLPASTSVPPSPDR